MRLLSPKIDSKILSPSREEGEGVGGLPRTLGVLAMTTLLLLACISNTRALVIDRIVAIVNNEIITLSEVEEDLMSARLGIEGPRVRGLEGSKDPLAPGPLESLDPFMRERLKIMVDKRLQLQIAKKMGISSGQEEVSGAIEDIKRKNSIKSDIEFNRALEEEHLTLERYTAGIKDQLTLIKLINKEVRSKIVVRDEELREYYDKNRSLFALQPEIRISQILIPMPRNTSEIASEDLRRKASGLVKEIRAGGDFFNTAKRYKDVLDGLSAADLGFFKKGDLVPPLEKAALSLELGEVSDPVETQAGIHIIRLDEKGSIRYKSFKEVAREIEEGVYQEKYNEALAIWLKEIRDGAHVEVRF